MNIFRAARAALPLLFLLMPSLSNAATNYTFSPSKCTAWSTPAFSNDYMYSFTITVPIGFNGVQVYILATSMKNINHDNTDELIELIINGRKMTFAAQGVQDSILIRPQHPDDTRFLLKAASTGSLSFGQNLVIPTAGTKHAKEYILQHCSG